MAKVKELFAANLKLCRVRLGYSLEYVAEISGLAFNHIKKLEEGKTFVTAREFECLSSSLGQKPHEMLYEGDEWEGCDSSADFAGLHIELKAKINDLLDNAINGKLNG